MPTPAFTGILHAACQACGDRTPVPLTAAPTSRKHHDGQVTVEMHIDRAALRRFITSHTGPINIVSAAWETIATYDHNGTP